MPSIPSRPTTSSSLLWAAIVIVLAIASAVLVVEVPITVVQLALGAALILMFMGADSDAGIIPRILRPAPIAFGSLTIASVSASALTPEEYHGYFVMWTLQVLGMVAGFLIVPRLDKMTSSGARPVAPKTYARLARFLFGAFVLAALGYFATQGIPALQSDLEQARVDAAQGGSGFIRMFAFLVPTVAAALVVVRGKRALIFVVVALVFMIGFGNRVPFIYFLFPLAVMLAVTTKKLGSVRIIGIAALLFVLMGALAAWRVYNTADMANSYQYRDAVARGDSVAIASSAVEHYAEVVPENAVLVKRLVDEGALPLQYGKTYFTLFASALPGRQVSPDMMIKELNGVNFIGGGIPPTLAGEGYMNLGYLGVCLNAMLAMLLLRYWAAVLIKAAQLGNVIQTRLVGLIYGYSLTWVCLAQISGFAGSATVSLAGFLVLVGMRWLAKREGRNGEVTQTFDDADVAGLATSAAR